MQQIPPETRRIQSLLTSLVIVTLVILGLVLVIAAYPTVLKPILAPATPPIPTQNQNLSPLTPIVTPIPSATRTLRATLTPTITATSTQTLLPSQTPTPPGPPTLTAAQPVRSDPYKLKEWTEDLANLSIELMNDFPNTLIPRLRGEDNQGYFDAFHYATIAGKEGLQRFPDALQAVQWRFDLAYNLAQTGSPEAGEAYAALLSETLNQGDVDLAGLVDWFRARETRLRLDLVEMTPPPGYLSSHILEVHGPGSAFIWLLETPSGYQAYVLDSNFDFVVAPEMRLIISDLTGDGLDDAAIFNINPTRETALELPRIFDLAEAPAVERFFRPSAQKTDPGMPYINNWRIASNEQAGSDLQLDLNLFDACPVNLTQNFHWDGTYFTEAPTKFEIEPSLAALSLCRYLVDHAINVWGPQGAIQIMEKLLPNWPPAQDEQGKPFPADARDEWRYRLGIYHALVGNFDQASAYLTELVSKPSTANSAWVEPAAKFLELYKQPLDLYRACLQSQLCDPNKAIEQLINQGKIPADQDPLVYLAEHGLTLRSSGYFDFDGDDLKERWFTVRHRPLEKLDLWVLATTRDGPRAIYLGSLEGDSPTMQFLDEKARPPVVWIEEGVFIVFDRDRDTGEPSIRRVSPKLEFPNRFKDGLTAARQALFAGEDLKKVLKMLQDLEQSPGLLCQANHTCDEYFYLLGLTNELLGNERPAVEAYLRLWRDYSLSPFTTLARLKLEGTIVPPTAIATSTLTPFPTGLLTPGTPTVTGTLGAGFTPLPTFTQTLPEFTPLVTSTSPNPYPLETATIEPTLTPLYP